MSIKQQLPEQLEGLSLGDVVVRVEQLLILDEDLVEVGLQEVGRDHLVSSQQVLKIWPKSVRFTLETLNVQELLGATKKALKVRQTLDLSLHLCAEQRSITPAVGSHDNYSLIFLVVDLFH